MAYKKIIFLTFFSQSQLSCTFTLVTGILGLTRVVELKQDPDKPWFETDPLDR